LSQSTQRHSAAFSRRDAPEVLEVVLPEQRAWGMPGARCTRGLACNEKSTRVNHHRSTGNTRHSRTRMVLTAYVRALPDVHDLLVTVICRSRRVGLDRADVANLQTWHQPRGARTTRFCQSANEIIRL